MGLMSAPLAGHAQSKWCAYAWRSPDTIIARHVRGVDSSDLAVSANPFPSRMAFRFTGGVRELTPARRDFLQKYFRSRMLPGADTLFQHELEARRDSAPTHWFPIQETTLEDFRAEVPPGDSTTLFLLWAGAYGATFKAKDWIFLINEFTSTRSSTFWSAELATCVP